MSRIQLMRAGHSGGDLMDSTPRSARGERSEAVDRGAPAHIDLGIDKDPDLNSLHGDPRFDALVAKAHQLATAKPP